MSGDGWRLIATKETWDKIRRYVAEELAHNLCEGCEESHYLPFGPAGQAHHVFGRGGGRRDDRPLVPLFNPLAEPNLARWRWIRNLVWTCGIGHSRLEAISSKSYRASLMAQSCECGLFTFPALSAGAGRAS